jgi:hypothetical protein
MQQGGRQANTNHEIEGSNPACRCWVRREKTLAEKKYKPNVTKLYFV